MRAPAEILVLKPSSLGDIVHTLPCVAMLRRAFPAAVIRWLINPEWAPLLEGNPHVDEIVLFPRAEFRGPAGWAKIPRWVKTMAAHKSDLVLDFQGLLRSALIAKLCRAIGGRVLGLSDAREGARLFYDLTANVRGIHHAVDRYAILTDLALDDADLVRGESSYSFEWPLPQGSAPEGFNAAGPFVILHPFSRGAEKSLAISDIADFSCTLAPTRVVLVGRTDARIPPLDHVTNLLNHTTLAELIWLIRHAAFTVSVDSGPMHIAAALTPRLLAIHKWSDPHKVGPYQPEAWVWKGGALCQMKNLDHPATHIAVSTMAEVAAQVRKLL
jgi:ADP-heptose:LPS heptosyltransferase